MRAIRMASHGGPEVLELHDLPDPVPGPGELLVAVEAIGVNFVDTYQRSGLYPVALPSGVGREGAGTVIAVGPGVATATVGDRVGWVDVLGSYADRLLVPAERAVPLPPAVPSDVAAAVLLQGMTAHVLTHSTKSLEAGDTVLVWAAGGGVGRLLVQLAARRGARVIAATSSDAKAVEAARLGAAATLTVPPAEVPAAVRLLTDDRGVEVVYDSVGAATFTASLDSCARRGLVVSYGQASGPVPPLDVLELSRRGSLFLTRPVLFDHVRDRDELLWRAGAVLGLVASGALEVHVDARLPLSAAADAHRALAARTTAGKVLLLPDLRAA